MEAQALPHAKVGDAPSEEADALTEDDQSRRADCSSNMPPVQEL